jgi:hypothetical protein
VTIYALQIPFCQECGQTIWVCLKLLWLEPNDQVWPLSRLDEVLATLPTVVFLSELEDSVPREVSKDRRCSVMLGQARDNAQYVIRVQLQATCW